MFKTLFFINYIFTLINQIAIHMKLKSKIIINKPPVCLTEGLFGVYLKFSETKPWRILVYKLFINVFSSTLEILIKYDNLPSQRVQGVPSHL